MAMELGAGLLNMSEAYWCPAAVVPGETYEASPLNRPLNGEAAVPHSVMVNRFGERFVNEATVFTNRQRPMIAFDIESWDYRNLPCWFICDAQFRENYIPLGMRPTDPDPDWLTRDETLEGLARKVGIDPVGLEANVTRFNGFARAKKDEDFHRGDSPFDRAYSDRLNTHHPTLGTIEKPPFYAVPVYPGALGTKGGVRTNTRGQVLDVWERPIAGLYAAGNVAASLAGRGYLGNGGTLGPGTTWGYPCGLNAGREVSGRPES